MFQFVMNLIYQGVNTMKAYKYLVKAALADGHTVSVFDGEEWPVKRSTDYKAIIEAIESVEEAQLRIRSGDQVIGWALIIPFGLEDDETVADHSDNAYMNAVMNDYSNKYDFTTY